MLSNLLFGPRVAVPRSHVHEVDAPRNLRSLTLDVDTLHDAAALLARSFPGTDPQYVLERESPPGTFEERVISPGAVETLSAADRGRLILRSQRQEPHLNHNVMIRFTPNNTAVINSQNASEPAVRDEVIEILLNNGTPRIAWQLVKEELFAVGPALGLALLVVWAELVAYYPLPVHVLAWVSVAYLAVRGVRRFRKIDPYSYPVRGHRIRMESRAQTASRRADEKKNLKVALITAPVTLAGGVVLALLTGVLDL